MSELQERYQEVQERIAAAAARAHRSPTDITLIAVTKTWPVAVILAAYETGMRHFGENRPEELAEKAIAITQALGPQHGIIWHLIGNLQSRKSHLAADHTDVFHALDRLKIAQRLSAHKQERGQTLPVFLEVNISGEASKAGFAVARWEKDTDESDGFQHAAATIAQLPGLQVQGLMTMAPWDVPEAEITAVFARTHQLAQWLNSHLPQLPPLALSMGMTDDFELAIAAGATHVRIGRAIFGTR
ncbi:MAG: YggS family pyridoxal phosphate-dependent enzyme [Chloroflexi bacterium]|nr:YggS family pyridoxal phosphate-dependent enzyme [Chloroflexota bacterium]MBP8060066.1 YggS family pyridoxal phosphate-dependent enzyme [Chloroflexota bacterium]